MSEKKQQWYQQERQQIMDDYSGQKTKPLINSISAYKDYTYSERKVQVSKYDLDFGKSRISFVAANPENDIKMKMDTERKI
jgi:hypothetical protein